MNELRLFVEKGGELSVTLNSFIEINFKNSN